jgi:integrase
MGSLSRLDARRAGQTVGGAAAAFLDTLEDAGTRRNYAGTLLALAERFESGAPLATLEDPDVVMEVAAWFTDRWGKAAPATFNRNLDALRSAVRFWMGQGWLADDPTSGLRRRRRAVDRTRSLSRAQVDELLARGDVALREKTLWRLLYETAARASEVLSLDVGDLDMRNRKAKVRRKGGAVDVIVWQTATARLLPRLLEGRRAGPVFLTERRARVALPPADLDPGSGRARLSYRRAAECFEAATGGWTLHQLRHSALTHAAEAGANTSTLLAFSGHTSVASLARYARVSPEALGRWQQARDPARRRR